jgi:hypothetical protein
LAKIKNDKQLLSRETSGASDQVDELEKSNSDLKKQLEEAKNATPPAAPTLTPAEVAGMVMNMMRGGGLATQQRMLLLKSRLHLTTDQEATIKAAMEADAQKRRELGRQMFMGGKIDPQAAAGANTLAQTLQTVLSPDQQVAYKQVQTEEQTSRADTSAAIQVNQVAPLLQLSDTQKDQVFNAIYQVQMNAPDPSTLLTNPNAMNVLTSQAQATQEALSKVLTPDQLALYEEQMQASPQRFGRRGGGGGGAPPPPQ